MAIRPLQFSRAMIAIILSSFVASLFVFLLPAPVSAGSSAKRQVILVVADYLEIKDLNNPELPHLSSFFNEGGIALLNTNTAGSRSRPNAAVTVSAGSVAMGTVQETLVYGIKDEQDYREIFQARTGYTTHPGNLVVLDIPFILRSNATEKVKASPGLLGETLHQKGLLTGALGNADLPGLPQRSMAVIAMDQRGAVDLGDVSTDLLHMEEKQSLVYRNNYAAIKSRYLDLNKECRFLVIELGDLVRLEQVKQNLTDRVFYRHRMQILKEYDHFLGWLLENTDLRSSQVMVSSLTPTTKAISENRTFGLIGVLGEQMSQGLLVSPTARRPGIVTLYDIAPSICSYLQATPVKAFIGRPWQVVPNTGSLKTIGNIEERTVLTSIMRAPLVRGYVILHLVVLASIIFCLFLKPRFGKYLSPLLLALLATPLVWLLVSAFPVTNTPTYLLLCLALVVPLVAFSVLFARNKDLDPILLLCFATVTVLLGDTLSGGNLQKYAVLSYDPMSGARFYGIGNEYMGVLIGATLVGVTLFVQRLGKSSRASITYAAVMFLPVVIILGAPWWGSEFGGFLTALIAFSYTALRLGGIRLQTRNLITGGLIFAVICFVLFLLDYSRAPELRSHFGQLIASIHSQGWIVMKDIIVRKLNMNYRLIKYTIWTRVLLGTLLALGIVFFRPVGIFRRVLTEYPAVATGLAGSLIGAFFALVLNDSGIVAAATAIIFPSATLFYLVLRRQPT